MRKSYRVAYERDEAGWWVAEIPSVPGCQTQGRTVSQARERVREALALFVGQREATAAKLIDDVRLPPEVKRSLRRAEAVRRKAEAARAAAMDATTSTVHLLTGELGLSMRDAAELLGLSHQRVAQIAAKEPPL